MGDLQFSAPILTQAVAAAPITSESVGEIAAALSKAQGEIDHAKKETSNPYFKSKYANLASVWDACREPLAKNGLAITQTIQRRGAELTLVTILMHSSGQWISSALPIKPVKDDPQGMGSAITYCRRYALAAMVGVAPSDDDDDGNAASAKAAEHEKQRAEIHTAFDRPENRTPRAPTPPPAPKPTPPPKT